MSEKKDKPIVYFDHVGFLVKDAEKTVEALTVMPMVKSMGLMRMRFEKEQMRVGEPFTMIGGMVDFGGLKAEVIEPVAEESPGAYMVNYLETHSEGLHHVAYHYTDVSAYEAMVEKMVAAGYVIVHKAEVPMPGTGVMVSVHYLEAPAGGVVIELKCDI